MPVNILVLLNDTDVDGSLDLATLTITNSPDHGNVTVSASGVITYTPEENFFGIDTFTYVIADDQGQFSNTALVTVAIRPVNDVPVAANDTYQLQGSAPLFVNTPGVLGHN